MSIQITDLTDATVHWLRTHGWIIKAPHFVAGRPVFTAIRR